MASLNIESTKYKHNLMELRHEYKWNHLRNDSCLSVISDGVDGWKYCTKGKERWLSEPILS